jgi:hypothetical protein
MPVGKAASILFFCVLGLALFFQTRTVEAQSCPVNPSCSCGSTCDENGNCTCNQQISCDCGTPTCGTDSSGNPQWQCASAPDCSQYGECYDLSCDSGSWSCDYDDSCGGGDGCNQCYCDASYCPSCNDCDPSCFAYGADNLADGDCEMTG